MAYIKSYKMEFFYGIKDKIEQYKFEEAKEKLESFLAVNQGDLFGLFEYAKIIIFDGDKGIDEAELILKTIINKINKKHEFGDIKKSEELLKNKALLQLIYLNIEKNNKKEAGNILMLLDESKDFDYIDNGLRISIFNQVKVEDTKKLSYLENQQVKYDFLKAYTHIAKYHQMLAITPKTMKFSEDIDIQRLMHLVKPFLIKENRIHINDLYDNYLFKIKNIGNYDANNCNSDFFIVKTIKGGNNIVTMFPLRTPSNANLEEADNVIDINDIDLALQKLKRK